MTAGIRIYNDYGSTQIDENAFNLNLAYKGTVTTTVSVPPTTAAYLTVTGNMPLLALGQPSVGGFIIEQVNNTSANTWQYIISIYGPLGTTIPYYVFDNVQTTGSTNGVGFQVFNASGLPTFSLSNAQPMRIRDVGFGGTYETGRTYAVVITSQKGRRVTVTGGGYDIYQHPDYYDVTVYSNTVYINGNQVSVGDDQRYTNHGTWYAGVVNNTIYYGGSPYLIVDVTNY